MSRDTGRPVSPDYEAPFAFTGGTIAQVVVDIGEKYFADLERDVRAGIARD